MRNTRSSAVLRLALGLTLAAVQGAARQGADTRGAQTFPLEPGSVLRVTNSAGAIRIRSWTRPEVELRVQRGGVPISGPAPVDVSRGAGRLEIRSTGGGGVEYDIRIPERAAIERIASASGSVSLAGLRGDALVETTSGSIRLEGIEGSVRATTTSGSIEAADVSGNVSLSSSTGRVVVERARGVLTARSVSGSVLVRGAEAVTASSTSSSVTVAGARGRVAATSTSGSVRLDDIASTDVEARSVSSAVQYRGSVERADATSSRASAAASRSSSPRRTAVSRLWPRPSAGRSRPSSTFSSRV